MCEQGLRWAVQGPNGCSSSLCPEKCCGPLLHCVSSASAACMRPPSLISPHVPLAAAAATHRFASAHRGLMAHSPLERPLQGLTCCLRLQLPCMEDQSPSHGLNSQRTSPRQFQGVLNFWQGSCARKQWLCTAHVLLLAPGGGQRHEKGW